MVMMVCDECEVKMRVGNFTVEGFHLHRGSHEDLETFLDSHFGHALRVAPSYLPELNDYEKWEPDNAN